MTPFDLVLTKRGVRFHGRYFPCVVGRSGVTAQKVEGDGATPSGRHRIVSLFYRPDRLAPPAHWATPIRPGDIWSDDPNDPLYNHLARCPSPYSHEAMRRADPLYDLVLTTDWNTSPAIPGCGSAIFLHQWRRPGYPTEGCIAFHRADLVWIAKRIAPGARVYV